MHDAVRELNNNLPQRVDELIGSRCGEEEFLRQLTELCAGARDGAWAVLARIDQNYRRGKLSPERFRLARLSIERRMLGLNDAHAASMAPRPRGAGRLTPTPAIEALAVIEAPPPLKPASAPVVAVSLVPLPAAEGPGTTDLPLPEARGAAAPRRGHGPLMIAILATLAAALIVQMQRANQPVGAPMVVTEPVMAVPLVAEAAPTESPPPLPRIGFETDRFLVQPGHSVAKVVITRTGDSSAEVRIPWWTESAGARAGLDFVARGRRTLVLAPGEVQGSVQVPILRNPQRRHIRLFYVRLGKPDGGELDAAPRAAVFIVPR